MTDPIAPVPITAVVIGTSVAEGTAAVDMDAGDRRIHSGPSAGVLDSQ